MELTADGLRLTTEIAVCDGIGLGGLGTAGEESSVEQVERLAQGCKCLRGIGVNVCNVNQRCCIFREVRTHRRCLAPEITLVLVGIVEGCTGVGKTRDNLIHYEVYITTNAEAVGVVVLGITEVNEILKAIVVDVGVEVCTLTATLNLQRTFRTVVHLADIFV